MQTELSIDLRELKVGFPATDNEWTNVVDGVTLAVGAGERVGLVGESGSGKSLTALACLGLVPEPGRVTGGSVTVAGVNVAGMSEVDLHRLRGGEIGLILQEAVEALNPVYTVGFQTAETVAVHQGLRRKEASREALTLLKDAALEAPGEIARAYPHELSGGQAQRVMLALALAGRPKTLIADEPTSALDSLTQAQVIELLDRLVAERKMGLLLISHDLVIVENMVDRIAVLFAGRIVPSEDRLQGESPKTVRSVRTSQRLPLRRSVRAGSRDLPHNRTRADRDRRGPQGPLPGGPIQERRTRCLKRC
jgi:ABC-type dipeptide/oligopeptide/nickel transport system ATPase component